MGQCSFNRKGGGVNQNLNIFMLRPIGGEMTIIVMHHQDLKTGHSSLNLLLGRMIHLFEIKYFFSILGGPLKAPG